MGIQFPPIAFLYLLYLFIYVYLFILFYFIFYIIHIFVQWYKALLNLNLNFIYTRLFENLKAGILKKIITWSVMRQQTAQSKKVYNQMFPASQVWK